MTMRALSGLPLDDDVVDRILTFCPSFATLQSAILVSKHFYGIFETHPRSITRSVAYNVVGPALPAALRVIRYPYPNFDRDDDNDDGGDDDDDDGGSNIVAKFRKLAALDPFELANACPEEHGPSVLTVQEKLVLNQHAEMLQKFEDIYSLTNKDRTSKTSVLTVDESFIFRQAAYRIMLFCNLFSTNYGDSDMEDDMQLASDDLADIIKNIHKQRTEMLNVYDSEELREMYSVLKFMKETYQAVAEYNGDSIVVNALGPLLACGPEGVVETWEQRNFDYVRDHSGDLIIDWGQPYPVFENYFSLPMENVWTRRGVKPPKNEDPASMYVLDEVFGANDTCSQCPTPGGLKLLTRANWDRPQLFPFTLLRSKLKGNPIMRQPYNQATANVFAIGNEAMREWIAGMWAYKSPSQSGPVQPVGSGSGSGGTSAVAVPAPPPPTTTSDADADADADDDDGDPNPNTSTSAAPIPPVPVTPPAPRMINKYTRDWTGWDVDMSYCAPCLTAFLEDHVWRWWADEWRKSGYTPPGDDCWYGYNCNTQTHVMAHAQKLNHLCVPTRGNP